MHFIQPLKFILTFVCLFLAGLLTGCATDPSDDELYAYCMKGMPDTELRRDVCRNKYIPEFRRIHAQTKADIAAQSAVSPRPSSIMDVQPTLPVERPSLPAQQQAASTTATPAQPARPQSSSTVANSQIDGYPLIQGCLSIERASAKDRTSFPYCIKNSCDRALSVIFESTSSLHVGAGKCAGVPGNPPTVYGACENYSGWDPVNRMCTR